MSNTENKSAKETPRAVYWRKMVGKWRRSGQTPEAFCRQRHLKAGTFAWWRPRLATARKSVGVVSAGRASSGFVEVRQPRANLVAALTRYELALANGRRILVGETFDEQVLLRLLRVVEAC